MGTPAATYAPVGVFDSGVGGLTVVREIRKRLPGENLLYLGDTARTPYGSKARETVTRFTLECVHYLRRYRIKALVVACNTASAYALSALRRLRIPVLGVIEPGARAALQADPKRPIAVIGTRATISSQAYEKAIRRLQAGGGGRIFSRPCPLLVPLVEEGWLREDITRRILRGYLRPLLAHRPGSLILGCTHYPAVKPLLAEICGPRVRLIDSAEEAARDLQQLLAGRGLLNPRPSGTCRYWVTDVPDLFQRVGRHLLGRKLTRVRRISLTEAHTHVRRGG